MGAMCSQSQGRHVILPTIALKIAVYGPPNTGKTSFLSHLFNKENSKSEKTLMTGEKKIEFSSNLLTPNCYDGTRFQGVSKRSKMTVQSEKDNGLPYHLWHVITLSNSKKSPFYHIHFVQIKNSEGNILPILQGLFLSRAFIIVVDAQTIDKIQKFQRLSLSQNIYYRIILLNKIDQLTSQSAQKLYLYLNNTYKNCTIIPISAKDGDNIFKPSLRTDWYRGPILIDLFQGEEPAFYQGISPISRSQHLIAIKVSHKNKNTTTIFGMYSGGVNQNEKTTGAFGFYGRANSIHFQYVLQVLPLGVAARVIGIDLQEGMYVSLTLDQYLTIDEEKSLFLKIHGRKVPQNPTSLQNKQAIIGTITFFSLDSIRQAGYKCLIHYHNKVVKGYIDSYSILYKNNEVVRHGKIQLLQLLWHEQNIGRFYILDEKNNPIAVGVQEPYSKNQRVIYNIQKKEPLKIEEEIQYKVTYEIKSKKTSK